MVSGEIPEIRYASLTTAQLMKLRHPVKICGYFSDPAVLASLGRKQLLAKLHHFNLTGAKLKNGTFDASAPAARRLRLFDGATVAKSRSIWRDYYFSEQIPALPQNVRSAVPAPFGCNRLFLSRGRLWLSGRGSRTPLHRDIPHNLILVTEGIKDIWLLPPEESRHLYPNSIFSRAPNFSRADIRQGDLTKFPKLRNLSVLKVRLRAGEMLYVPPLWWHDVLNIKDTASINYWFAPVGLLALAAYASVAFAKLTGIHEHPKHKFRPGLLLSYLRFVLLPFYSLFSRFAKGEGGLVVLTGLLSFYTASAGNFYPAQTGLAALALALMYALNDAHDAPYDITDSRRRNSWNTALAERQAVAYAIHGIEFSIFIVFCNLSGIVYFPALLAAFLFSTLYSFWGKSRAVCDFLLVFLWGPAFVYAFVPAVQFEFMIAAGLMLTMSHSFQMQRDFDADRRNQLITSAVRSPLLNRSVYFVAAGGVALCFLTASKFAATALSVFPVFFLLDGRFSGSRWLMIKAVQASSWVAALSMGGR